MEYETRNCAGCQVEIEVLGYDKSEPEVYCDTCDRRKRLIDGLFSSVQGETIKHTDHHILEVAYFVDGWAFNLCHSAGASRRFKFSSKFAAMHAGLKRFRVREGRIQNRRQNA